VNLSSGVRQVIKKAVVLAMPIVRHQATKKVNAL
jgi:hypothetical protein